METKIQKPPLTSKQIYDRERYQKLKEKVKARVRRYRIQNLLSIRERDKARYYTESRQQWIKDYTSKNRESINGKNRAWIANNRPKVAAYQRRRRQETEFRLRNNLRTRLNQALKGNFKSGSAVNDLGCSIIRT